MVIADTGFFVALLIKRDAFHSIAKNCYQQILKDNEELITTCAVMTETMHILASRSNNAHIQQDFLASFRLGAFHVFDLKAEHGIRLQELMAKYADLPMDLADASLVVLAESIGHGRILSTDMRDFGLYRWKQTHPFTNLMIAS